MDAKEISKVDLVNSEREFLHEISTPLMVALGLTEKLEEAASIEPNATKKNEVERLHRALNKITEALMARRQNLLLWTQELEEK